MSDFTSIGIIILTMLILAFLQFIPGIFLLFNHYAFGKYSKAKATDLAVFFILGVETAIVLTFLLVYSILCTIPATAFVVDSDAFAWTMAVIFFILSSAMLLLYYRKGAGTKLFVSRRTANYFQIKITTIKSRSDAFVFGLVSTFPELILTLPLYLVSTIAIMRLDINNFERAGIIIVSSLVAILPLLIIHFSSHARHLADFIRFRFKNKPFFRACLFLSYFLVATLIILGISS